MNRTFKLITLALVLVCGARLNAQERFSNPRFGFGFSGGGAQGANSQSDKWVLHYGGFVQYKVFDGTLLGQTGVQYNKLMANDYWAKIAYADQSFLFVPYSTEYFNPFVKFGIGVAKPVYRTGTQYIGVLPFGAGVQTKFSPNVLMQFELFYVYSLSDSLDGRPRSLSDLNPLTNGGQDSFYGARVGLILGTPPRQAATSRARSDREAQREMNQNGSRREKIFSRGNTTGKDIDSSAVLDSFEWQDGELVESDSGFVLLPLYGDVATDNKMPTWADMTNAQKSETIKKQSSQWKKIGFAFGQTALSNEAQAVLREILAEMQRDLSATVYVVGYTDNLGKESVNKRVSLYRAELVKQWLVDRGIEEARLQTLGKGSEEPLADNATDAGRAMNRRVEFWKK